MLSNYYDYKKETHTLSSSILKRWSQACWLHGFHIVCATCTLSSFNTAMISSGIVQTILVSFEIIKGLQKFKNDNRKLHKNFH